MSGKRYKKCVLIGNPNTGKSTLFSKITGSVEKAGNWHGVTVNSKTSVVKIKDEYIEFVDLPGIYDIAMPNSGETSRDQAITIDYLYQNNADCILHVIDANQLERQLYLTLQLLELGLPICIFINKKDTAVQQGISLDIPVLQKFLKAPILYGSTKTEAFLAPLLNMVESTLLSRKSPPERIQYSGTSTPSLKIADDISSSPDHPNKGDSEHDARQGKSFLKSSIPMCGRQLHDIDISKK